VDILIKNSSNKPIYEQIASQLKSFIIAGVLKENEILPSIRSLAKELRISVITTQRAYEELEKDGFIVTVPGKGCYVAKMNTEFYREQQNRIIEDFLVKAVDSARLAAVSEEELHKMLSILYKE
jgi:Predicted transcriptional regulators